MGNLYLYDIFISYKRGGLSETFVRNNLAPLLQTWVDNQWSSNVRIFLDTESIRVGDNWASKIITALNRSKLLLTVWTPTYFRSNWCKFELETFERRAECLEMPLTIPLLLADGEHLPSNLSSLEVRDLRDYASIAPAFSQSVLFIEFEKEIRRLSADIAKMLDCISDESPPKNLPLLSPPTPDAAPKDLLPISLGSIRL